MTPRRLKEHARIVIEWSGADCVLFSAFGVALHAQQSIDVKGISTVENIVGNLFIIL